MGDRHPSRRSKEPFRRGSVQPPPPLRMLMLMFALVLLQKRMRMRTDHALAGRSLSCRSRDFARGWRRRGIAKRTRTAG